MMNIVEEIFVTCTLFQRWHL